MKKQKYNNNHIRLNGAHVAQLVDRRHFIRHPVSLPLAYRVIRPGLRTNGADARSETINASVGGLLFPARRAIKTNSIITIKMPLEDKVFNVKAKVVRCVTNRQTKLYDVAVSFPRRHEAFKTKMIEQIYLITEYRDLLNLRFGKEVSLEEASRKWIKRYSGRFKRLYW